MDDVTRRMGDLSREFRRRGVFTTSSVLDSTDLATGVVAGMQLLRSAFFRPNVLFLDLGPGVRDEDNEHLWAEATRKDRMGIAVVAEHPRARLGRRAIVHLWFTADLLAHARADALTAASMHLAVLTALRLERCWRGKLRVFALVDDEEDRARAVAWLDDLRDLARIPLSAHAEVVVGPLEDTLAAAPNSDLDIVSLPRDADAPGERGRVRPASSTACRATPAPVRSASATFGVEARGAGRHLARRLIADGAVRRHEDRERDGAAAGVPGEDRGADGTSVEDRRGGCGRVWGGGAHSRTSASTRRALGRG